MDKISLHASTLNLIKEAILTDTSREIVVVELWKDLFRDIEVLEPWLINLLNRTRVSFSEYLNVHQALVCLSNSDWAKDEKLRVKNLSTSVKLVKKFLGLQREQDFEDDCEVI
jgi:hypothetical protein